MDLPSTWCEAVLGDVARVEWGNTSLTKASYVEDGYSAFSASGQDGYVPHFEHDGPGIVLSAIGARCGKCFLANGKWATIKNTIAIDKCVTDRDFLFNYLNNERRWPSKGGAQPFITLAVARALPVPLPPLREQRRIVAKIDSLSAKSGRARENLDHIPRLVEKYKQAVLAAAFRGELTLGWRMAHAEATSGPLLKELAFKRLSSRRSKMPTRNLIEADKLPQQWTIARAEDVCSDIVDGTHFTPEYVPAGVPFISVKDIRDGKIDFSDCKHISNKEHEELAKRCRPQSGDLLITKSGTIGRCAVVQEQEREFSLFVSVALIRPATNNLRVKFLEHVLDYWISTIDTGSEITGTAIKNLHLQDIKALGIPIPSTAEQDTILSLIDHAYSWIDRLVAESSRARRLIDHLDQAILAKAFRGELVPQDPNDEPASRLLERIKAERQAAPAKRGSKSRIAASS